jgi:hypothetical protein
MDRTDRKIMIKPMIVSSLFLFLVSCFATSAYANSSSLAGTQLAYFVGYPKVYAGPEATTHHANRYRYKKVKYHSGRYYRGRVYGVVAPQVIMGTPATLYWTNWRFIGTGCRQQCLVNRVTTGVIRCVKRC